MALKLFNQIKITGPQGAMQPLVQTLSNDQALLRKHCPSAEKYSGIFKTDKDAMLSYLVTFNSSDSAVQFVRILSILNPDMDLEYKIYEYTIEYLNGAIYHDGAALNFISKEENNETK